MSAWRDAWDKLDPTKKKYAVIASGVSAILLLVSFFAGGPSAPHAKTASKRDANIQSVLTDADPRQAGMDAMAQNINDLSRRNEEILRQLKDLQENKKKAAESAEKANDLKSELDQVKAEMAEQRKQQAESIEKALKSAKENAGKGGPAAAGTNAEERGFKPGTTAQAEGVAGEYFSNAPTPEQTQADKVAGGKKLEKIKIRTITEAPSEETVAEKEDDDEVYIPSGSIINGALITGLDAPTGNNSRRDPFPVLLRVKQEAVLPNRFRADIRECFLIASGFGDLSSERAYIRGETISCVREDGGVIEARLDAYASGEDGKAGVRGRLISKQGQMIARSLMAGFLQGAASAFTPQKVPSLNLTGVGVGTTSSGTVDPVYERSVNSDTLQVASLNGTGKAMERIADYYLQMAEGIFPIIEIDAARQIDFIITRGASLKLKGSKKTESPLQSAH